MLHGMLPSRSALLDMLSSRCMLHGMLPSRSALFGICYQADRLYLIYCKVLSLLLEY